MAVTLLCYIVICVCAVCGKNTIRQPQYNGDYFDGEAIYDPEMRLDWYDYYKKPPKPKQLELAKEISDLILTSTKRDVPKPRYHRFHDPKYSEDPLDAIFESFRTYPGADRHKQQRLPAHRLLGKPTKTQQRKEKEREMEEEEFEEEVKFDEALQEPEDEVLEELRPYRPIPGKVSKMSVEDEQEVEEDDSSLFAFTPDDPRYYQETLQEGRLNSSKADEAYEANSYEGGGTMVKGANKAYGDAMNGDGEGVNSGIKVMAVPTPLTSGSVAGVYIVAIVAGISAAATVAMIAFGIGWYNLKKNIKNSADVEYPAYGVTGPNKDVSPSGDRRLAQSAQMYHYQHQKQQIIAMENRAAAQDHRGSLSEVDSDEENEEGDYTVYECPGLATTGELEVKNPLFQDDPTPAQKNQEDHKK